MYRTRVVGFLFLALLASCNDGGIYRGDSAPEVATNPSKPAPSPTPQPTRAPRKYDAALEKQIKEIASEAEGTVGVAAEMLETGQYVALEPRGKFPTQSVYKLPIAMAVFKKIDEGQAKLDQEVVISPSDFVRVGFHSPIRNLNPDGTILPLSEILRASISESDGTASDILLGIAGGPVAVQNYLGSLGINDMIVADSEKEISKDWETQYRNWSTPEAAIELLRVIYERRSLSEPSNDLLLQFMRGTEGSPKRLIRGLPEGATLVHKTGTGGTKDKITGATNDIGIITLPDGRHIAIAVFIMDSSAPAATRADVTAKIARSVIEKWAPGFYPKEDQTNSNRQVESSKTKSNPIT